MAKSKANRTPSKPHSKRHPVAHLKNPSSTDAASRTDLAGSGTGTPRASKMSASTAATPQSGNGEPSPAREDHRTAGRPRKYENWSAWRRSRAISPTAISTTRCPNADPPEELDEIYIKLRNLEVEIVDQAEVDRVKQPEPEEEDEKARLDILDDPVRMYLKQMGQVPLLTREQEVEISKRIEDAENEVKRIDLQLWFRRQGTHRPGGETPFRTAQRTVRPRHPRQENRQPRRAPARAAQADQARCARRISRWTRSTPPGRTAHDRAETQTGSWPRSRKLDRKLQKTFRQVLLQAEGRSRKWRWWRRTSTTRSR